MRHHLKIRTTDRSRSLSTSDEFTYTDEAGNEVRGTSLLHIYKNDALAPDVSWEFRQIRLDGLRLRGKEFSLLSSKNSGCETIGWRPV